MKAEKFEDLKVWEKSHQLALAIYKITKNFPAGERFGLISQMRRAAVSVPANLAEGFKKRTLRDKINFYNIAQGSLEELRYYLILSNAPGYLAGSQDLFDMSEEIGRMLCGLIRSIQ